MHDQALKLVYLLVEKYIFYLMGVPLLRSIDHYTGIAFFNKQTIHNTHKGIITMDIKAFFNTALSNALTANAQEAKTIGAKYQINVGGAGNWHIDLTDTGPKVVEGKAAADCTVDIDSANFEKLMSNPKKEAPMLFMFGKLKVSGDKNLGLRLEKVFSFVK